MQEDQVHVAKEQLKLSSNPAIGIEVKEIKIDKVFEKKYKRRNMEAEIEIVNIGNDPAIEILIDGEIELEHANVNGINVIPARFTPSQKSFLMPGEKFSDFHFNLYFGNTLIEHFLKSHSIMRELNDERIKYTPWEEPYQTAKLIVYIYYSNNIGQHFKSKYIVYIYLKGEIPKSDETAEVDKVYIPRPTFSTNIISTKNMNKEIEERNKKRDLCGW